MALEPASFISQLDPTLPTGDGANGSKSEGDDILRMLKTVLQSQFPNLGAAAVTPTAAQLNTITAKAAKAGDTYTGTHDFTGGTIAVPTLTPGTSTTGAASSAFVTAAMAALSATSVDLTTSIVTGTSATGAGGMRYVLTNVGATTVTTPASPTIGQRFGVVVANGLTTNSITYGSDKIMGLAESMTLTLPYSALELLYVDATEGWILI